MKIKYIVGGLVVVVLVFALIYVSVGQGSAYYITIEEALAGKAQSGQAIRIDGYAEEGTVVWDAPAVMLRFDLVDLERTHRLPVVFHNAPPEGFVEGGGLMVEGTMGDDGTFQASQLLTRCPSKYEEYK
ncbi:MAG: cytochrome c maturation protein CcmE [Chloroflexi bacterium]|nr:cytochrome c maturation protein CcmE [Chloroflexota bacterium]MBU1746598.1 cytochrome c maturation protein CcmE [Chloroflexota bacterium]